MIEMQILKTKENALIWLTLVISKCKVYWNKSTFKCNILFVVELYVSKE